MSTRLQLDGADVYVGGYDNAPGRGVYVRSGVLFISMSVREARNFAEALTTESDSAEGKGFERPPTNAEAAETRQLGITIGSPLNLAAGDRLSVELAVDGDAAVPA